MIRILTVDDEPLALRQLAHYAAQVSGLQLVGSCQSATQARTLLCEQDVDALFLDINMPDVSGLEFIRSLPDPPLVVFTTAYPQYALEGFRVNAVDYLLKPFSLNEFKESCARISQRLDQMRAAERTPVATAPERDALFFKLDYKTVRVPLGDIRFVESMSEYVKIHLMGQSTPLVVLYSLKRLTEQLPAGRFLRIHRSFLINMDRLAESGHGAVRLDDGTTLPVSDSYRPALKQYLEERRV